MKLKTPDITELLSPFFSRNYLLISLLILYSLTFYSCWSGSFYYKTKQGANNDELTLIRHFNSEILEINRERPKGMSFVFDFYINPGQYSILIQPIMHVSSFPRGNHLYEKKYLSFVAKPGHTIYLCLGLIRRANVPVFDWKPFIVNVPPFGNKLDLLITSMETKGGCVSDTKTLPHSWIYD